MALFDSLFERMDSTFDSMVASVTSRRNHHDDEDIQQTPASSSGKPADDPNKPNDSDTIINGVALPRVVADQLKRLGLSLSWYSKGELEAAIAGCSVDCNLIDDPDGMGFFDHLKLDEREKDDPGVEIDENSFDPHHRNPLHPSHSKFFVEPDEIKSSALHGPKFRDKIKAEREKKGNSLAGSESKNDGLATQMMA